MAGGRCGTEVFRFDWPFCGIPQLRTNHDQSMREIDPFVAVDMLNIAGLRAGDGSGGEPSNKKPKDGVVDLVHLQALQDVAGSRTMPQNGDPLDHWMSCKGIYW